MTHINWLEWFGYTASVIVAVSLMMSSIVKLRWYNLLGALAFSAYGFLIRAYPVGVLNAFIACADIYYLVQIYSTKEQFRLITFAAESEYLKSFFDTYRAEISRLFPRFDFQVQGHQLSFCVLRNLMPTCVFVGTPGPDGTLEVDLDFVVPTHRDFKPGAFLFRAQRDQFLQRGFHTLRARSRERHHDAYLERMGFVPSGSEHDARLFTLNLK